MARAACTCTAHERPHLAKHGLRCVLSLLRRVLLRCRVLHDGSERWASLHDRRQRQLLLLLLLLMHLLLLHLLLLLLMHLLLRRHLLLLLMHLLRNRAAIFRRTALGDVHPPEVLDGRLTSGPHIG